MRYADCVRWLGVLGGALVAMAAVPATANAWCQSCTVVREPLSCAQACYCPVETDEHAHLLFWDQACIEVTVEDDPGAGFTTAELDAVVDRSFARWTELDCGGGRRPGFDIRRTEDRAECDISEYVSGGPNANSVVVVQDGWEERLLHDRSAYALTTTFFFLATGEIIDADMELNDDNWQFAVCPDEGCTCPEPGCDDTFVDLENTITHEAGHFFGLAHADSDSDATMWACADTGDVNKRSLEADDIEGMCTVYGEGALPDACDYEPRGGFDPYCKDDRDEGCGCRVTGGRSPASRPWLFALTAAALLVRRRRGQAKTRSRATTTPAQPRT